MRSCVPKDKEYRRPVLYNGGESLDSILPEAFATVREAAKTFLGMEHHRVQLIGGIILHQGRIAEMAPVKEKPSFPPFRLT